MHRIDIFANSIEIHTKPIPGFVKALLIGLLAVSVFIPVLLLALMVLGIVGLRLGVFIGIGIAGLVGYYFWRVLLWNVNGKQIIERKEDKLICYSDYKRFIDSRMTLVSEELQIEFIPIQDAYYLLLRDERQEFRVFAPLPEAEANRLSEAIQKLI
jgi:hypothetical protein